MLMAGPKRRVRAGEVNLEVLEADGGGQPLLLVHGFCGAKEDFAEAVPLLAERAGYREFCDGKTLAASADMWLGTVDEMLGQEDRLGALADLRVLTLVIVGEQDEPFRGDAQGLARGIPGARLALIADAGYSPQFEAQEPWWQALSGFLDEVVRRRVPR